MKADDVDLMGTFLTFPGQFGHTWVRCFWRRGRAASIIDELNLEPEEPDEDIH